MKKILLIFIVIAGISIIYSFKKTSFVPEFTETTEDIINPSHLIGLSVKDPKVYSYLKTNFYFESDEEIDSSWSKSTYMPALSVTKDGKYVKPIELMASKGLIKYVKIWGSTMLTTESQKSEKWINFYKKQFEGSFNGGVTEKELKKRKDCEKVKHTFRKTIKLKKPKRDKNGKMTRYKKGNKVTFYTYIVDLKNNTEVEISFNKKNLRLAIYQTKEKK